MTKQRFMEVIPIFGMVLLGWLLILLGMYMYGFIMLLIAAVLNVWYMAK